MYHFSDFHQIQIKRSKLFFFFDFLISRVYYSKKSRQDKRKMP